MGLRPTAAKAFQLHPEASGPQHPVAHFEQQILTPRLYPICGAMI
jgi:hypothetical protein